ncbi:MAG: peptidylprolyl isomerase [Magnetococcales bacterium]|nr:peptidylprolyl isomerase [Magnetococcales bacterium]
MKRNAAIMGFAFVLTLLIQMVMTPSVDAVEPYISAGVNHTLGVHADGTLWVWGRNSDGQFGNNTTSDTPISIPTQVPNVSQAKASAAGLLHSLLLKEDGSVWVWGNNGIGQLGLGSDENIYQPTRLWSLSDIAAIDAGDYFSAALDSAGYVWSWGHNQYGQLGLGSDVSKKLTPSKISTLSGVQAISVGSNYMLALKQDGTVWGWGRNDQGQLGQDPGISSIIRAPVQIAGLPDTVVAISAGNNHAMAMTSSGALWVWGDNYNGQLGIGNNTDTFIPITVSTLSQVVAISASTGSSVVLRQDGTLWSWGQNNYGQLGLGHKTKTNTPAQISTLTGISKISAGGYHFIAQTNQGELYSWGGNNSGQLGNTTTTNLSEPAPVVNPIDTEEIFSLTTAVVPGSSIPVTTTATLSAGPHSLAVSDDGDLWGWGFNAQSQTGVTGIDEIGRPEKSTQFQNVSQVSVGGLDPDEGFSAILKRDGTVWIQGWDAFGYLTASGTQDLSIPVKITGLPTDLIEIEAGAGHVMVLQSSGVVWSWGYNGNGQLGNSSRISTSTPAEVSGLSRVVEIATGSLHSVALTSDGVVYSWGENSRGELGLGHTVIADQPTAVPSLGNITAIAAGERHTMVKTDSARIRAWGANHYGQLGLGDYMDRTAPTLVPGLYDVHVMAGGRNHSVALLTDGTGYGWGDNRYGQLGTDNQDSTFFPAQIPGLISGIILDAWDHTLVLRSDGHVLGWGRNDVSQLGLGISGDHYRPIVITTTSGGQDLDLVQNDTQLYLIEDNGGSGVLPPPDGATKPYAYAITGQPEKGIISDLNTSTGAFTYTPFANANGVDTITYKANTSDAENHSYEIIIEPVNDVPIISGSPVTTIKASRDYSFQPDVLDVDGQGLTFTVENLPAWASFNTSTGKITGTPQTAGTTYDVTITVSDGTATAILDPFSITVLSLSGPAAVISPTPGVFAEPVTVSFDCEYASALGCTAIHYTTNGTSPTTSSPKYSAPFVLSQTTTLRYFAIDGGGYSQGVKSAVFTVDDTDPVVSITTPVDQEILSSSSAFPLISGAVSDVGGAMPTVHVQISNGQFQLRHDSSSRYQWTQESAWIDVDSLSGSNGVYGWSLNLSSAVVTGGGSLPSDFYTIKARAIDAAGNSDSDMRLFALGSPAQDDIVVGVGEGVVNGVLFNSLDLHRMADVTVTVGGETIQTDTSGRFSLALASGSRTLTTDVSGYLDVSDTFTMSSGATLTKLYALERDDGDIGPPGTIVIKDMVLPTEARASKAQIFQANALQAGGEVTDYLWLFEDGNTRSGSQVIYTFKQPGSQTVTLTVTGSDGNTLQQSFTVDVAEARYAISGMVSGLSTGDQLIISALSESKSIARTLTLTAESAFAPFTIENMQPASDYRLFVTAERYADGYWQGVVDGLPTPLRAWDQATLLDLSEHDISGINIQVEEGISLTVNLTGTQPGDMFDVMAYSDHSGSFVWTTVTALNTSVSAMLTGLISADDYQVMITPQNGDQVGGFYAGDGLSPAGEQRAAQIDLTTSRDVHVALSDGMSISGTVSGVSQGPVVVEAWSSRLSRGGRVMLNSSGSFAIKGLPPASDYRLFVESDYQPGGYYSASGLTTFIDAMRFNLESESQSDVDVFLSSGRSVSGTVSNLPDAVTGRVNAWSNVQNHFVSVPIENEGGYVFSGLHSVEDYRVSVEVPERGVAPQLVDLTGGSRSNINFSLLEGGRLDGVIYGLTSNEQAQIEAWSSTNDQQITDTIYGSGYGSDDFTLRGILPADDLILAVETKSGRYYFSQAGVVRTPVTATRLSLDEGETLNGLDMNLTTSQSLTISGSLTGIPDALADQVVTITAISDSGSYAQTKRSGNGDFQITGVPSGSYSLSVSAPDLVDLYYSGSSWQVSHENAGRVTILSNIANLSIAMSAGRIIAGDVWTNSVVTPGVTVQAWDDTLKIAGSAVTAQDGSFEITGLSASGTYNLEARKGRDVAGLQGLSLASGDQTGLLLELESGAGSIVGTIENGAGALVLIHDSVGDFVDAVVADSNGAFAVTGLNSAASYRVDVDSDGDYSVLEVSEANVSANGVPLSLGVTVEPVDVTIATSLGAITLELYPDKSPITVANFLEYVDSGYYSYMIFHRVIQDFMIQGGGFELKYSGGDLVPFYKTPNASIVNEAATNGLSNLRGTIAMARQSGADTATSQFFINHKDNLFLDYQLGVTPGYAVFGQVTDGLDVVDTIAAVETTGEDSNAAPMANYPIEPVLIYSISRN